MSDVCRPRRRYVVNVALNEWKWSSIVLNCNSFCIAQNASHIYSQVVSVRFIQRRRPNNRQIVAESRELDKVIERAIWVEMKLLWQRYGRRKLKRTNGKWAKVNSSSLKRTKTERQKSCLLCAHRYSHIAYRSLCLPFAAFRNGRCAQPKPFSSIWISTYIINYVKRHEHAPTVRVFRVQVISRTVNGRDERRATLRMLAYACQPPWTYV